MASKICKKCGWVMDINDPTARCPICHTRFDVGKCRVCGEIKPYYSDKTNACRECFLHVVKKQDDDKRLTQRRRDVFDEWLVKISKVPKDYPRLTEAQWLEACRYFNGCAYCGAEAIDSRGYFVKFKDGGRYCDWNIIPMCEHCAMIARSSNLFIRNALVTVDRRTNIIAYLEDKLNAAIKS